MRQVTDKVPAMFWELFRAHTIPRSRSQAVTRLLTRVVRLRVPRHFGTVCASALLLATNAYAIQLAGLAPEFGREAVKLAGLTIDELRIEGQSEVPTAEIIQAINTVAPAGLMTFDADKVRASVEDIGWVATATVLKLYPNTVQVSVREHQPFALWQHADEIYVIAENGTELADYVEAEHGGLPLFVGAGANTRASHLTALLRPHSTLSGNLRAAVFVGGRRWDLILQNGTEIRLPELSPELALARVQDIADTASLLDSRVSVVDVRLSDRIVLRRADGEPVGTPEEETGT